MRNPRSTIIDLQAHLAPLHPLIRLPEARIGTIVAGADACSATGSNVPLKNA